MAKPVRVRDPLGLRRAVSGWLLPALVAAMALLAAIALGGAEAAEALARRWEGGAAAAMLVQLQPGLDPVPAAEQVATLPGVAEAIAMDRERLSALLHPWLGDASGLPLPPMIEVRLTHVREADIVAQGIAEMLPGAQVEQHGVWVARLSALARSLQAMAWMTLALVGGLATAILAVATRAGIAARRDTITILHELGATDGTIARQFARRIAWLAACGATLGVMQALPLLFALGRMASPLLGDGLEMPWLALLALIPAAALIAWFTALSAVRMWLKRLP
jgi:cell division transport system permease protein